MCKLRCFMTSLPSMRLFLGATLSLWMLMAAGCASRMGDFSFISTGTPQYSKMDSATIKQGCEGSDSRLWVLFIPLGSAPSLDEAVDNCMDDGRGDYIERARLYATTWSIGLFSSSGYKVIGDVGNSKSGNSAAAASGSRQQSGSPNLIINTGQQNANTNIVPSGPVITGPNNNNAGSANNSSNGGGNGSGGNRH